MKRPDGRPRLVFVTFEAFPNLVRRPDDGDAPTGRYAVLTRREFTAHVLDPANPIPSHLATTAVIVDNPNDDVRIVAQFGPTNNALVDIDIKPAAPWRIFAGQVDPADPTRLTIPCDIAGRPLIIDGRLDDGDRLLLIPRAGRLAAWRSGTVYEWDLSATPAATTMPTTTRRTGTTPDRPATTPGLAPDP